jgi:hypothetical protein
LISVHSSFSNSNSNSNNQTPRPSPCFSVPPPPPPPRFSLPLPPPPGFLTPQHTNATTSSSAAGVPFYFGKLGSSSIEKPFFGKPFPSLLSTGGAAGSSSSFGDENNKSPSTAFSLFSTGGAAGSSSSFGDENNKPPPPPSLFYSVKSPETNRSDVRAGAGAAGLDRTPIPKKFTMEQSRRPSSSSSSSRNSKEFTPSSLSSADEKQKPRTVGALSATGRAKTNASSKGSSTIRRARQPTTEKLLESQSYQLERAA